MLRQLFYMQRSDRQVVLALLCVVAVALVVLVWAGDDMSTAQAVPAADSLAASASPDAGITQQHRPHPYYKVEGRQAQLFPFDPNTADSTQLLQLGLQPWQVRNIYKYRAAGGIYRRPEDFARLYGLTVGQYRRLAPYIRIAADYQPAATLVAPATASADTLPPRPAKLSATERIDLNTSDTTALQRVPGIGPYYARQIVRYGQRLGGYVSVSQLDEIDNFPAAAKQYFIIQSPPTHRLNLNSLSLAELRRHPYINYYQAKAITDYRRLHGSLQSLQQLSLSPDFTPEAISRLEPYVEF